MEWHILKQFIDPQNIKKEMLESNGLKGLEAKEFLEKINGK